MANFTNWIRPDNAAIELEYKVEYTIKPLKSLTGNAWPTVEDFKQSVAQASVKEVTPEFDRKIQYRSHTRNKEEVLGMIRGYASYPQFRNEQTIDAIYDGFKQNKPMKMPIVLEFSGGRYRVMGGNTRMDIAFQLGINPKVLIVKVPEVGHGVQEQYELEEFFGINFTEVGPNLVKQFKKATPGQSSKYIEGTMTEDTTLETVLEAVREITVQYRVGLGEPGGKSPVLPDWDMKEVQKVIDKYIGKHTEQIQMKTMYPSPFTQGMNRGQYHQKIHRKIVNEINEFRHPEWREAYAAGFASMIPVKVDESISTIKLQGTAQAPATNPQVSETKKKVAKKKTEQFYHE